MEGYSNRLVYLNIITINKPKINWAGKKWALYNAINAAKGEIIIQTDADCTMGKNWLKIMVQQFNDISVGFVASLTPMLGKKILFDKLLMFDSIAQDELCACAIYRSLTGESISELMNL